MQPSTNHTPQYRNPFTKNISSRLHAISAFELLENINENPPNEPYIDEKQQDSGTLLAHAASIIEDRSPADIRKVLSTVNILHELKDADGREKRASVLTYYLLNWTYYELYNSLTLTHLVSFFPKGSFPNCAS